MADTPEKRPLFQITSDGLKNLGAALSICITLFGLIKFAIGKIDEYDSHAARIAKLEARESSVQALIDGQKLSQFKLDSNTNDLANMKVKIEGMSNDIVNLRISDERMRSLLEGKKR